MNQESKAKLTTLRALLSAVNPCPWQDHVAPWAASALPLIVEHYSKHVESFRDASKAPDVSMRPRKSAGATRFDPITEPTDAAIADYEGKAREACDTAHRLLITYLGGLIDLPHPTT